MLHIIDTFDPHWAATDLTDLAQRRPGREMVGHGSRFFRHRHKLSVVEVFLARQYKNQGKYMFIVYSSVKCHHQYDTSRTAAVKRSLFYSE